MRTRTLAALWAVTGVWTVGAAVSWASGFHRPPVVTLVMSALLYAALGVLTARRRRGRA